MKFWVRIESEEKRVSVEEKDGLFVVDVDGTTHLIDCRSAGHRDYLSLIINNKSHLVESAPINIDEGRYYVNVSGRRYDVEVLDERLVATRKAVATVGGGGTHVVTSPMPGLILDVKVKVGDEIKAGTPVVVMEAMKMQNELISEVDGVVKEIRIEAQQAVDSQTPLIEIEST